MELTRINGANMHIKSVFILSLGARHKRATKKIKGRHDPQLTKEKKECLTPTTKNF